ncbi:MAG TPA: hypothetical protein VJJ83_04420, partial [Candidatus Babeliales bacterium]|nr:hypothetical protein [Candidatus Babeliales bacterium]
GFNKSHSAAYALIAYQTAYLKANYPAEFMASLISLEANHPEKMSFYLDEAKALGLKILPPDINRSQMDFTVLDQQSILYGLLGIKNLGVAALENILAEQQKQPFSDLLDFCTRIDLRTSNKRVLEHLIYAGAFDNLPGYRSQKLAELNKVMELASATKEVQRTGQLQLFSSYRTPPVDQLNAAASSHYQYQPLADWSLTEKLKYEKEVIGFYVSAHPLDQYQKYCRWLQISSFQQLLSQYQDQPVTAAPIVLGLGSKRNLRVITTKKGDQMCFLQLEDYQSQAEVVVFPKLYQKVSELLAQHELFIVQGELELGTPQKCKLKATQIIALTTFWEHQKQPVKQLTVQLTAPQLTPATVQTLRDLLENGKTDLQINYPEQEQRLRLASRHNVLVNETVLAALEQQGIDFVIRI